VAIALAIAALLGETRIYYRERSPEVAIAALHTADLNPVQYINRLKDGTCEPWACCTSAGNAIPRETWLRQVKLQNLIKSL